jgi:carboxymethylenebutenolidase
VLVLGETAGVGDPLRDACDRLAREGFTALAPELGCAPAGGDAAPDLARLGEALDASLTELFSLEASEGPRLGALGFGAGGELALLAASRSRRIAAVVDCYGVLPQAPPAGAPLAAAVLGISGERDARLPPGRAQARRAALEAAGARVAWRILPGAGHDFLDGSRPDVFDARAAAEAWEALLAFLRSELA